MSFSFKWVVYKITEVNNVNFVIVYKKIRDGNIAETEKQRNNDTKQF